MMKLLEKAKAVMDNSDLAAQEQARLLAELYPQLFTYSAGSYQEEERLTEALLDYDEWTDSILPSPYSQQPED